MKDELLSSGTEEAIENQTIDHNQPAATYNAPIAIGHPVEIFLFPIRLRTAGSAEEIKGAPFKPDVGLSGGVKGAPFKPDFGLSGQVETDENPPLDLCASAEDEPPKSRRPALSRGKPRQGLGGPQRRLKFTAKRLGEIAEAKFLAKAADLGFTVLKPWGDSEAYDFILDPHRGRDGLRRVQVKSAHRKAPDRGYSFSAHDFSLRHYRARDVDAFVAFVVPEDAWYVIPIRALYNTRGIHLFPTSRHRRSKYEKYRDAWWRLHK